MKTLRNVFAALAIVFAIGAAYASTLAVTAQSRIRIVSDQGAILPGTCQILSINLSDCQTANPKTCDRFESSIWYRYFSDNACQVALKKP